MNTRIHGLSLATLVSIALVSGGLSARPLQITGPEGQVRLEADTPIQEYGPTKRTDTLWRIANEVRPDEGITIYQVMLSIYQANPHAFNSTNFNSLERGKMLRIPTREVMASMPASEARARARQDDKQWQPAPAKAKPAATQPSKPAAPSVSQAELDKLKAENARLTAQLAEQSGEGEQIQRLRSELATSVEELATMLEQNEQLKRRLDALNTEIGLLQSALDEQQTLNQELEQQMEAGAAPAAQPAQPVQPDPMVAEPESEPTVTPPSFWQGLASNPWLLTLAAVVPALALLLALFAWLRRRNEPENDALAAEQDDPALAEARGLDEHNDDALAPPQIDETSTAAVQLDPEMEEEGQSLSDLLREQESARDEVDLDRHLMMDDDLDALLAEVDKPVGNEPESEPSATLSEADALSSVEEAPARQNADLDFDIDFESQPVSVDAEPDVAYAQAEPTPAAPAAEDEPFIDIDKLLEESDEEVEVAYPGVRFELEGEPLGGELVEDESAINAKLDLARAYIEIDDHDSARALLKEVAFDGNEQQKAEANSLLEQL